MRRPPPLPAAPCAAGPPARASGEPGRAGRAAKEAGIRTVDWIDERTSLSGGRAG